MNAISHIAAGCEMRVDALKSEFGAVLAARLIEAEAADFLWEARCKERYRGQHIDVGFCIDEDEIELSRIAVLSFLDGRWHAGSCLVDGEGCPADLLWMSSFSGRDEAEAAFERAY